MACVAEQFQWLTFITFGAEVEPDSLYREPVFESLAGKPASARSEL